MKVSMDTERFRVTCQARGPDSMPGSVGPGSGGEQPLPSGACGLEGVRRLESCPRSSRKESLRELTSEPGLCPGLDCSCHCSR